MQDRPHFVAQPNVARKDHADSTTRFIRDGEMGWRDGVGVGGGVGGYGVGGIGRLYNYRYTVTTRMIPAA